MPSVALPSHRAIRAALFAVVCVGVGATLHGAAGGCAATWAAIALALPALWLAAWAGLAEERSWPALTAGLGAAQVGLHFFVTALASGAATAHATAPAVPGAPPLTQMAYMPPMPGMDVPPASPYASALAMITAHALAVVVCGWWLGQGEQDFFALCRAVGALAAAPLHRLAGALAALVIAARRAVREVPQIRCAEPPDGIRHCATLLLNTLTFRGPPALI